MNTVKYQGKLAGLLLVLASGAWGSAQAQEEGSSPMGFFGANHFDKEWGVTLGLKAWLNEWSLPVEIKPPTGGKDPSTSQILQYESSSETTFIPVLMARYRNFFIGGSYLPEKEYRFSKQTLSTNDSDLPIINLNVTAERKEWDLNLGYFITPNLAASLGYKKLDRKYTYIGTIPNTEIKADDGDTLSVDIPIIGLSGSAPVGHGISLYSNLAYGWAEGDSSRGDMDGNYYFGELGLNYSIPLQGTVSAVTLGAGYRFQRVELQFKDQPVLGSAGDQNDSTSGFVANASVSF